MNERMFQPSAQGSYGADSYWDSFKDYNPTVAAYRWATGTASADEVDVEAETPAASLAPRIPANLGPPPATSASPAGITDNAWFYPTLIVAGAGVVGVLIWKDPLNFFKKRKS